MVSMQMAPAADQLVPMHSAESLVAQAVRYEHGEGIAKNPRRAAELYCAAARQGSPEAAYRLGWMYANARGIERDDRYAVALYQRAAAQGHEYAKRMLQMIRSEDPVLPDCIAAPVSALIARTESATMEQLAQAERAKAEAAIAELARTEQLVQIERTRAETAKTERAKAEQLAHAERAKLETARVELAKAQRLGGVRQTQSDAPSDQVMAALALWADAWSRKDVDGYLSAYATDFFTAGGRSRRQWERERRARIVGKSWIAVTISALEVRVSGNEAHARFVQEYRSDKLGETSRKMLTFVKPGDRWLIRQERSAE